jgi:hypothetical protein
VSKLMDDDQHAKPGDEQAHHAQDVEDIFHVEG